MGSVSWGEDLGRFQANAAGPGTVAYLAAGDRIAVALWTSSPAPVEHSVTTDNGEARHSGRFVGRSGETLAAFGAVTEDGRSGEVTVAGTAYDLADGPAFLVAVEGKAVRVRQLRLEVGEGFGESIGRLGADPDARAFFRGR